MYAQRVKVTSGPLTALGGLVLIIAISSAVAVGAVQNGHCAVSSTPIAFGRYDPVSHLSIPSVALIHYRCLGTVRRLAIGLTKGKSATFAVRVMSQGPHQLSYNLYLDAAGTQVWGDGSGGSKEYTVNTPAPGADISVPVFGRISGRQNVPVGSYQDDVAVLVNY